MLKEILTKISSTFKVLKELFESVDYELRKDAERGKFKTS